MPRPRSHHAPSVSEHLEACLCFWVSELVGARVPPPRPFLIANHAKHTERPEPRSGRSHATPAAGRVPPPFCGALVERTCGDHIALGEKRSPLCANSFRAV